MVHGLISLSALASLGILGYQVINDMPINFPMLHAVLAPLLLILLVLNTYLFMEWLKDA